MARKFLKRSSRTLWILCEGETERRYFQNLQAIERKRQVRIRTTVCQNKRADLLVEEAIKFKTSSSFEEGDVVVCLFDRDNNTNTELKLAGAKAFRNDITIYFSNPCFEVWLLSHYEKCSSCEPDQIRSTMKQKYKLDVKSKTDLYETTMPNLSNAIERCEALCRTVNVKGIGVLNILSNPITEIHKLIAVINSFN